MRSGMPSGTNREWCGWLHSTGPLGIVGRLIRRKAIITAAIATHPYSSSMIERRVHRRSIMTLLLRTSCTAGRYANTLPSQPGCTPHNVNGLRANTNLAKSGCIRYYRDPAAWSCPAVHLPTASRPSSVCFCVRLASYAGSVTRSSNPKKRKYVQRNP